MKATYHKTRAEKYGAKINDFTVADWLMIVNAAQGACHYCKDEVGASKLHPDHQIPLSKQGDNTASNVVAACSSCNCRKGTRTSEEFEIHKASRKHTTWHQAREEAPQS